MQRTKTEKRDKRVAEILDRPYSRILIPQEDGRLSAEILEFPGCFAEGSDPENAYSNLAVAAESWVAACLANDTPVPPPLTNYEVSGKFALRLPRSLYIRASKAAAKEGVSLNQYVTAAVAERLGADGVADRLQDFLRHVERPAQFFHILIQDAATTPSSPSFQVNQWMKDTAATGIH